ncbi:MAG: hypothetical protein KJ927_05140 [Candidatus Eisenbacteria bacterium]|nr:hypothetical protein [Candidatus Eisenbacteria bacterium]
MFENVGSRIDLALKTEVYPPYEESISAGDPLRVRTNDGTILEGRVEQLPNFNRPEDNLILQSKQFAGWKGGATIIADTIQISEIALIENMKGRGTNFLTIGTVAGFVVDLSIAYYILRGLGEGFSGIAD